MNPVYEGSITDVQGIEVGQAENREARTGVTVVLTGKEGAVVAADVRGASPGTRETDLCNPENTVERAHAVVLSGGSAFGLASADGVMNWLEKQGIGFNVGVCRVPIVPAAVIFDLGVGDSHVRPDAAMGAEACSKAGKEVRQGAFGAGTGATVGKMFPGAVHTQGGVGTASLRLGNGVTVGAIAVVNACGDVCDPHSGAPLSRSALPDGTPVFVEDLLFSGVPLPDGRGGRNTTIAAVATDAVLTKTQARRMAVAAHDGYARAIHPVHTMMDGDTVFALATGLVQAEVNHVQLQAAAAEVTARAIANAVIAAREA